MTGPRGPPPSLPGDGTTGLLSPPSIRDNTPTFFHIILTLFVHEHPTENTSANYNIRIIIGLIWDLPIIYGPFNVSASQKARLMKPGP